MNWDFDSYLSEFDSDKGLDKMESNIGSNGDGSCRFLEVPRTADLWESRQCLHPLGNGIIIWQIDTTLDSIFKLKLNTNWFDLKTEIIEKLT